MKSINNKIKKVFVAALAGLMVSALLTGCSSAAKDSDSTIEAVENESTESKSTENRNSTSENTNNTEQTTEPPAEQATALPRELTETELEDYADYINRLDCYGFLLSSYDDVKDVRLSEVFYTGAGADRQPTDEEINAYLKAVGQDELYTDLICIPAEKVDSILMERTGYSFEDMYDSAADMNFVYIEEYDAYFHEVGDTNYVKFVCNSGTENEDGTVTLECEAGTGGTENEYVIIDQCTLTLDKESMQFISNEITDGYYLFF